MQTGDYLVDPYRPTAEVEPRVWRVEEVNRGKVVLRQVNPLNLSPMQSTKRVDVAALRNMYQLAPDHREGFRTLMRQMRQVRLDLGSFIEGLPADFKADLPSMDDLLADPLDRTPYGKVVIKFGAFPNAWLFGKADEIAGAIRDGCSETEVRQRCNVRRLPMGFYEEAKEALKASR